MKKLKPGYYATTLWTLVIAYPDGTWELWSTPAEKWYKFTAQVWTSNLTWLGPL